MPVPTLVELGRHAVSSRRSMIGSLMWPPSLTALDGAATLPHWRAQPHGRSHLRSRREQHLEGIHIQATLGRERPGQAGLRPNIDLPKPAAESPTRSVAPARRS